MTNKVLELPTLYKQTATGAIQGWTVRVFDLGRLGGEVETEYGQVDGQQQKTSDTVSDGKNLGKSNETTPLAQAQLQAQQQWDKKKKQGYTESLDKARATTNVLDAIKPMLAHVYEDHVKKVTWPAYVQPKLDGFRCLAIVSDGKCRLYSRTQKEWLTMPHVVADIEDWSKHNNVPNFILDGELYNHGLRVAAQAEDIEVDGGTLHQTAAEVDFNRIASIVKRNDVHPDHKLVQYHIYDLPSAPGGFEQRFDALCEMVSDAYSGASLKIVETNIVESEDDMNAQMAEFLEIGYEGLMYRRADGPYEGKRSHGLLKVKTFQDAEFEVCGVEEGSGRLQGKAGAIWCYADATKTKKFKAKMRGSIESLVDYLKNFEKYRGRMLTVKYQNLTPDGAPRFPVGIRFRVEE